MVGRQPWDPRGTARVRGWVRGIPALGKTDGRGGDTGSRNRSRVDTGWCCPKAPRSSGSLRAAGGKHGRGEAPPRPELRQGSPESTSAVIPRVPGVPRPVIPAGAPMDSRGPVPDEAPSPGVPTRPGPGARAALGLSTARAAHRTGRSTRGHGGAAAPARSHGDRARRCRRRRRRRRVTVTPQRSRRPAPPASPGPKPRPRPWCPSRSLPVPHRPHRRRRCRRRSAHRKSAPRHAARPPARPPRPPITGRPRLLLRGAPRSDWSLLPPLRPFARPRPAPRPPRPPSAPLPEAPPTLPGPQALIGWKSPRPQARAGRWPRPQGRPAPHCARACWTGRVTCVGKAGKPRRRLAGGMCVSPPVTAGHSPVTP